jgi:hypothetical protein
MRIRSVTASKQSPFETPTGLLNDRDTEEPAREADRFDHTFIWVRFFRCQPGHPTRLKHHI